MEKTENLDALALLFACCDFTVGPARGDLCSSCSSLLILLVSSSNDPVDGHLIDVASSFSNELSSFRSEGAEHGWSSDFPGFQVNNTIFKMVSVLNCGFFAIIHCTSCVF